MTLKEKRERRKPVLQRDQLVILVVTPPNAAEFEGRLTVVASAAANRVRVQGDNTDFDQFGVGPGRRAILVPQKLQDSWRRSAFLRDFSKLSSLKINADMLASIDAENEPPE